ncbi:hypothetical protein CB0940_05286 [Cercospora beticola]|uniref:Uncharacterized protein n=2 Tax=Cercospora beticola TaxID=122368 RepID=A0A2G5HYD2_CERBT|nr:hypothetical protein CB0940_05286 [Cercospora beticola]PIA97501.1 hypothetical protein CB0940_05286 [Cercospora beticola]
MAAPHHQGGLNPAQNDHPSDCHPVMRRKPLSTRPTDSGGDELVAHVKRNTHEHDEDEFLGLSHVPQESNIGGAIDQDLSRAGVNTELMTLNEKRVNSRDLHKTREPFWTRKSTLCLFIAVFVAMAVSLLSLWSLDQSRNGFHVTSGSKQYAWTYAPTAVLVVVISLWRQVDYQCKMLQPWRELYDGSVSADRSILLDYISPLQATSLIKAIRYRHTAVIASICGFAILKLIVLFSTGLFVLKPTILQDTRSIKLSTSFDGKEFWNYVQFEPIFDEKEPIYRAVGASCVQTYYGILRGDVETPKTVVELRTFQCFELDDDTAVRTVSTEVDVFEPQISCEIAEPDLTKEQDHQNIALRSETCSVGFEHQDKIRFDYEKTTRVCESKACKDPHFIYVWERVNCSNVGMRGEYVEDFGLDASTIDNLRYALVTGTVTSRLASGQEVEQEAGAKQPTYNVILHEPLSAAVICKVDYTISRANVTHDPHSDTYMLGSLTDERHLEDHTGVMLGEILYGALMEASNLPFESDEFVTETGGYQGSGARSFYSLLQQTLGHNNSMQPLLSPESLQKAATLCYAGMSTHFMHKSYLRTTDILSEGRAIYEKERLRIGLTSMSIMTTGFLMVVLCTLCLVLTMSSVQPPDNTDSLATRAMILRASSDLQDILRTAGMSRTSQLTALLDKYKFTVLPHRQCKIEVTPAELGLAREVPKSKQQLWAPLAAKYPMISLMFLMPLAMIVVLEVLNRISVARNGILDVSTNEDTASIVSRYATALVMLLIATCFNNFDFLVSSLASFSLLCKGAVSASRSIHFHPLGSMPLVAIMQSFRAQNFASVFSNFAAMTGSTLTVVASGLLFVDHAVTFDSPVRVTLESRWDITRTNFDNGAGVLLDQVQHGMNTMPITIWNNTVFPMLRYIRTPTGEYVVVEGTRNYTMRVDALRPQLDCKIVPDGNIIIVKDDKLRVIKIEVLPELPPGCHRGGQYDTDSFTNISVPLEGIEDPSFVGRFLDLHLDSGPETAQNRLGEHIVGAGEQADRDVHVQTPDAHPGCPSIGIVFVKTNESFDPKHNDITALLCSQKLEMVSIDSIYYRNGSLRPLVDTRNPHMFLHESTTYLMNVTNGGETFSWPVQHYLSDPGGSLSRFNKSLMYENHQPLDLFFDHVTFGPNGTALEDMAGPANRGTLSRAVQNLYNRYMCLVIDKKFREPISPDDQIADDSDTVQGTMWVQRSRLKVNTTSKLALQIMLAAMTALGLGAWWLTNLRRTLPRNPCSIASTMALLAGSDLCDGPDPLIPDNALSLSKQEQLELFSGWMFSLGWWRKTKKSNSSDAPATDEAESSETLLAKQESEEWRFGIDVVMPERLGFRERTRGRRKGREHVEAE